jgi:DNA (cytosine-5)-methyltransferase 1
MQKAQKFKAISLFAGVGGVCLGFKNAGFDIVFANDFDKNATITYNANFSHGVVHAPIETINEKDIPDADIVLFGFPCQAFSIAGYQKGFSDNRGHLFFEALRIIKAKKPKSFFLENVKNLVSHDNGNTFKIIKNELENAGYFIKYKVLNSKDYGNVPQNRERIFMVGFLSKENWDNFEFPEEIKLTKKITDITHPNEKKDDKYYYNNTKYAKEMLEVIKNQNTVYQWRRIYIRENKSGVSPTLTANMGTGGHNVPLILDNFGVRKLTPRECFLLQGFPESFILPNIAQSHLYKQAGNSVTVSVVEQIAKNIFLTLSDSKTQVLVFKKAKNSNNQLALNI